MSIQDIVKEIFRLRNKSLRLKKPVGVEILMGKSDIYQAYMVGSPLVNDDIVRLFDSFTGYESLQILITFNGYGGVREKLYAIKR